MRKTITVKQIMAKWLQDNGYQSLCALDKDGQVICHCDTGDEFMECRCDGQVCVPAHFINDYDRVPDYCCCSCSKYKLNDDNKWYCAAGVDIKEGNEQKYECDLWTSRFAKPAN